MRTSLLDRMLFGVNLVGRRLHAIAVCSVAIGTLISMLDAGYH
ncbi:hypothetical protein [uncultured Paracoccus sp.]|nr:hypothetical protein [uncultured Paracoccus sp.]